METIFLQILDMSAAASFMIPSVLISRLILQKAPKIFSYTLWSLVFIQLLFPISLESPVGLLPSQVEPTSHLIFPDSREEMNTFHLISPENTNILDITVKNDSSQMEITPDSVSEKKKFSTLDITVSIWSLGVLFMVGYAVFSYLKLKKILAESILDKENVENVYLCDHINSPFVLGIVKPNIYLPSSTKEEEKPLILAHEKHHIKRFDHVTRPLSFLALCIHWFNPLVWIAYKLSGKDMELSCDEGVLKDKSIEIRGEYVYSLLKFASPKEEMIPLAFSKKDLKGRVKNIMNLKKMKIIPVFMVSIISIFIICILGMKSSHDTELLVSTLTDEEFQQIVQEVITEAWKTDRYEVYDPTKITYFMNERIVSHPVVEEDVNLSSLLSEAVIFHFYESIGLDLGTTELTPENSLFYTFLSIFDEYYLSPIDYNEHPWGGGYYVENNRFYPDNYFQYGYIPQDLVGILDNDKPPSGYVTAEFSFSISDTESLGLVIYQNYNVTLEKITFGEEAVIDYDLPYCLKGENREIVQKINDFLQSPEYRDVFPTQIYTRDDFVKNESE